MARFFQLDDMLRKPIPKAYAVISFPKCGRTWTATMFNVIKHMDANFPGVYFSHDIMNDYYQDNLNWCDVEKVWNEAENQRDEALHNSRIVFLVRNPRDVVVSYYYQKKYREPMMKELGRIKSAPDVTCDIDEFVHHDVWGFKTIIEFYNMWVYKDVLRVSYEDMRTDVRKEITRMLEWYGVDIKDEYIDEAIRLGSWESMKEIEQEEIGDTPKGTRRVRKGKTGGYKDELKPETITWMNEYINKNLNPVYKRYWE